MFCRAHVLLVVNLAPQANEIVQPPQVHVFVVALHPGGSMVDRDSRCEGNCLPKVDEVDTTQVCAVIDKQEGAPNNLMSLEELGLF